MKKAMITGITGQDGSYLARLLLDKGYKVYGAFRRASDLHLHRPRFLGISDQIEYVPTELLEFTNLLRAIDKIQPDEVYNLAAQSFVAVSFDMPTFTADVTGMGALRVLEVIRQVNPKIRFYQASSSEMFGKTSISPQNEQTPFHPRSPYGVAKLFAHWSTVNYREAHDMFACSGILFNHESPLRGHEFVTRKITRAAAAISNNLQEELVLGNLDARRDWGFAGDYVEAMWMMLQQDEPDDYVIASGENHSVREFAEAAFRRAGIEIEWRGKGIEETGVDKTTGGTLVRVDPAFYRPAEIDVLTGDSTKAGSKLGWSPKVTLAELVNMMVDSDMRMIQQSAPYVQVT